MIALLPPLLAASAALAALAALLLRPRAEREDAGAHAANVALLLLALGPLAASLLAPHGASAASVLLALALALALLLRDPGDTYASEAALKLAWVCGAALALSVAGELLLALSAGTARASEQGPALSLALDPYALWGVALVLSLLVGIVLLAGAPFHFWAADLAQGAPLHVAPLLLAALPATGAADADPVEVLEFAMESMGKTQAELGHLITRSRATEIMKRKRKLTLEMIRTISEAWHIPVASLVAPYKAKARRARPEAAAQHKKRRLKVA